MRGLLFLQDQSGVFDWIRVFFLSDAFYVMILGLLVVPVWLLITAIRRRPEKPEKPKLSPEEEKIIHDAKALVQDIFLRMIGLYEKLKKNPWPAWVMAEADRLQADMQVKILLLQKPLAAGCVPSFISEWICDLERELRKLDELQRRPKQYLAMIPGKLELLKGTFQWALCRLEELRSEAEIFTDKFRKELETDVLPAMSEMYRLKGAVTEDNAKQTCDALDVLHERVASIIRSAEAVAAMKKWSMEMLKGLATWSYDAEDELKSLGRYKTDDWSLASAAKLWKRVVNMGKEMEEKLLREPSDIRAAYQQVFLATQLRAAVDELFRKMAGQADTDQGGTAEPPAAADGEAPSPAE